MLYNQIMDIYGFYIIMAGVVSFILGALAVISMSNSALKKLDESEEGAERCFAKVIKKHRGKVYFEIETGEILILKTSKKEYNSFFDNVEGVLTYSGNKVISFE